MTPPGTTTTPVRHLDRPDGRRVTVHGLTPGTPAGAPVVLLCHPAPGSGRFDPDPAATAAAGVRLVGVDRPGYGGSDVRPDTFATVADAAGDAAAVLEDVLAPGMRAGWPAGPRGPCRTRAGRAATRSGAPRGRHRHPGPRSVRSSTGSLPVTASR